MSHAPDSMKYGVLYVDDEEQALKYFRKGLDKDFRILTASSAAQAMTILEKEGSSLAAVITDQRMPGGSGVELLTQIRQRWPAIVRILITAHTDLNDAVAAVNAGAIYKYIHKPADFSLLRQILTEAIQIYRHAIDRDALEATLKELEEQRRATQASEAQREELQHQLLNASRDAGRAEVATGILHNVGNVLNSVNISVAVLDKRLQESKVGNLIKALAMLQEHGDSLADFFAKDERGRHLPGYLLKLAEILSNEQSTMLSELVSLRNSLEHIGEVVQMQQAYAKVASLRELVAPESLVDDAIRMNRGAIDRAAVNVIRESGQIPPTLLDKHKVLQILINLVSNAVNAVVASPAPDRRITIRTQSSESCTEKFLRFQIIDTGVGIPAANLTRIFTHGFTTRHDGHGFGLHSSANVAHEMGGSLSAFSEGPGRGATFTLELPLSLREATDEKVSQKAVLP